MNLAIREFTLGAALLLGSVAAAAEPIARADAEALFQISGMEQQLVSMRESCVQQIATAWGSPNSTARRGEKFYGRTPASSDWANIVKRYDEYAERACNYPKLSEWKNSYVAFYAKSLSRDTYLKYRQFLLSPEGQEITKLSLNFNREWAGPLATQQASFAAGAFDRFLEQTGLQKK